MKTIDCKTAKEFIKNYGHHTNREQIEGEFKIIDHFIKGHLE